MNTEIIVHAPPQPTPNERVQIWRERVATARFDQADTLKSPATRQLSKWFEGMADATDRCADELQYHVLRQIDGDRLQYLQRIAETADAFEKWLDENAGTNDDWPVEIKTDAEGGAILARLLTDLKESLAPLRAASANEILNCGRALKI